MKSQFMNKTSTQGSGWRWDCDHFASQKEPFKLQNVSSPDDEAFCNTLSATHNLKIQKEGETVTFTPSC
jgi:hypothetical protein